MAIDSQKQRTCSECGGTDIVVGIAVTKTADSGHIGLSYKGWAIFLATEQLYADLCKQCGTVVRFYVRDSHKPWT
jgi:hypothetical protein